MAKMWIRKIANNYGTRNSQKQIHLQQIIISVNFVFKGIGQLLHILIEDAYICKFLAKHLNFGAKKLDKSENLLFT